MEDQNYYNLEINIVSSFKFFRYPQVPKKKKLLKTRIHDENKMPKTQ